MSRIVVTGASRGLGRALVAAFAASGHRVFGCGRSRADLASLAASAGEGAELTALDLTTPALEEWAAAIVERGGAPDLVINNAAVINAPRELWRVPEAEMARLLELNVLAAFRVARALLPAMIERRRGVLVNFSSGWGRTTAPRVAPYCASKFAIEGMTRALAQELPPGIAAVAVNPGIVDTDMLRVVWGSGAGAYPAPERWAKLAAPFLLGLGPEHNGRSLSVPD